MRRYPRALALIAAALVLSAAAITRSGSTAGARGDDICPEPNHEHQAACFLGPDAQALGFIAHAGDADTYRIEVLDFNAQVRVELAETPAPYRLTLANWTGEQIAASSAEGSAGAIDTALGPPGSYYLVVDSPTGQSSEAVPYRLSTQLLYPGSVPQVLYSRDFGQFEGASNRSNEYADFSISAGRFTVVLKRGGSLGEAAGASSWQGVSVGDFTAVVDSQIVGGPADPSLAGYMVHFRSTPPVTPGGKEMGYYLQVNGDGNVRLWKVVDGVDTPIRGWTYGGGSPATEGLRTVVQCIGPTIRVNLNGRDVLEASDETFHEGQLGFGAFTSGEPITAYFDNVLIIAPTPR